MAGAAWLRLAGQPGGRAAHVHQMLGAPSELSNLARAALVGASAVGAVALAAAMASSVRRSARALVPSLLAARLPRRLTSRS